MRSRSESAYDTELAAARESSPGLFEFDTTDEARIFAYVLRGHGHTVRRDKRNVRLYSAIPLSDIVWADANAFKYGPAPKIGRSRKRARRR